MDFETTRRRIIEREVREGAGRLDPETAMVPVKGKGFPVGAHSWAGGHDIRSTAEIATALALAGDSDLAWRALDKVLDYQDTDPASFTYGNFFWYSTWKRALDPNAVSFVVPPLVAVLRERGDTMPPALSERIRQSLALAVTGLNAHRATWGYTNITLLNMASKFLIGDVLEDPRARDIAYWDWEEWRNHTVRMGMINEYNSLTYTWVQIHSLAMMLSCRLNESFLREARAVMRHLITASVMDYHPGAGRITGPQSRAYEGNRRRRGDSAMDWVLHFVAGTPEPAFGGLLWLGVPIGPEDVLPAGRDLPLPRTTRTTTLGFTRTNYLAPDYALGSISGPWPWEGHETPFFLAYRSSTTRCSLAFRTPRPPEGIYSRQREGGLLAGLTWLLDPDSNRDQEEPEWWRGRLTGLNTGRPHNLIEDQDFVPEVVVELGLQDQVRLFGAAGDEVTAAGEIPGEVLVVETESIVAGLRFAAAADCRPALSLDVEPDGEYVLTIRGGRPGIATGPHETATFLGFALDVLPRAEAGEPAAMARSLAAAPLRPTQGKEGWNVGAPAGPASEAARLAVFARTGSFYGLEDAPLSPNAWAVSLQS